MEDPMVIAFEVNLASWMLFETSLQNLDPEEADWRPVAQANNISIIVRHLRIEAQWHLDSIRSGATMPGELNASEQEKIDSISLDFAENYVFLDETVTEFLKELKNISDSKLKETSAAAYREDPQAKNSPHLLAFHQAVHLNMHTGQIRMIRNLFRTTQGKPILFFPENHTIPGPTR